ncbi:DUF748 domain-containing protein [Paraburkholderia silvatlantica]|uniref:DUF748 domain-containing protein n=1 Tax=Paraburkholderia silvatlantica TaxID=321895 RepID=A0ABR6FZI9_9BURK|nr:DUF748 domain-containing protein [Paraburkholderia silvatlantica]MBB2932868.1 hypothetical protein [Paraburkholderia silvatlantica]PVY18920.1 uncharacterized protein DUF748 [Paraburkholderia silvatlantica]PXW24176.1 uncharacterized protein DUF748 [Paraburkholderia silvatlantica]
MAMPLRNRVPLIVASVVALLALAALGTLYALQREAKTYVERALAPVGMAASVKVAFNLSSVELTDVRLKPPPNWPAADTLRAARITITPDLRALISHRVHVRDVTVSDFTMTVLRRESGSILLLPNLREAMEQGAAPRSGTQGASNLPQEKIIDHIGFENGTFDFYDRSISNPPWRVTVNRAQASVDNVQLPALTEPTRVSVTGNVVGPEHTGRVAFDGWIQIASKDSQLHTTLRGVDVRTIDPYLLRKAGAKANVTGGTLDLDLASTVRGYHLHAPGSVTLRNLQLAESGDAVDTFLSIPTRAAVAALKARKGEITLHFVLDGNLRDPKFKLNENLMTELRAGFAQALGVSAEGVAKGAGQTAKGIADALRSLLQPVAPAPASK